MTTKVTQTNITANLFTDYPELRDATIRHLSETLDLSPNPDMFSPGHTLPQLDSGVSEFAAPANATWRKAEEYKKRNISILDLTGNPNTNTEKTLAATLMVARAVNHIQQTGEPVMIFSPSSANKATALRDAVLRAIEASLVEPRQLRIVTLVPSASMVKLRESRLSTESYLRDLNPVFVYSGKHPEQVKSIGKEFTKKHAKKIFKRTQIKFWYSLEFQNYVIADALRAFFERSASPVEMDRQRRIHVHAVSSAYGLLGYHTGREVLESKGLGEINSRPESFIVQHLQTPYMILHYLNRNFDRSGIPEYKFDSSTGLYHQSGHNKHFPETCIEPNEQIDPTFYTHCPPTSPDTDAVLDKFGGGGIVVSLPECIERYSEIQARLASAGYAIPADLRDLREWSTVMAFTGALNAIDRGLIQEDRHVIITGSGTYTTHDFDQINTRDVITIQTPDDIADVLIPK